MIRFVLCRFSEKFAKTETYRSKLIALKFKIVSSSRQRPLKRHLVTDSFDSNSVEKIISPEIFVLRQSVLILRPLTEETILQNRGFNLSDNSSKVTVQLKKRLGRSDVSPKATLRLIKMKI
jgi:hypothetical protein